MKQIIWLFLLFSMSFEAQVDTTIAFEQVEVMATRLTYSHGEGGRDIRIVDRQEIVSSGVRSIDEAIQLFGGIEVQTRGVYGAQADFSVRGSTFNQVQVLLDGQSILDPLTGHFNSNMPVGIQEVRKIEIIRGPSASIYGPNAVGGVINIVTDFSQPEEMSPRLYGGFGYGDYDLRTWEIGGNLAFGKLKGFANHHSIKTDGPKHFEDTTSQFVDVKTTSFGLVYLPNNKLSVGAKAGIDHRDFDARYYYTRSSFDRSTEKVDRLWLHGKVDYQLKTGTINFNYSRIETDDHFLFNPAFAANDHSTYSNDARLDWKNEWTKRLNTNLGGQIINKTIESNDRGNHDELQWGLFAIGEYLPLSNLVLSASARLDYHPIFEYEFNPHLGVVYKLGEFNLRGLVGRTSRAADFTERFISFGRSDTLSSGRNLGNPNLQAENSWNSEIGISWTGSSNWDVGFTLFQRNAIDLIDYILTPGSEIDQSLLDPSFNYFYTQNIGKLNTQGLELFVNLNYKINKDWKIKIGTNTSFIQSDNNEDEVSKYLASHAGVFGSYFLEGQWKNVTLNLNGGYKIRDKEIDGTLPDFILNDQYHILNTKLNVTLFQLFHVYAQVNNLADEKYSDVFGVQLPGRWWSFGFRAGF